MAKKPIQLIQCRDCRHAYLMRRNQDPVIALCKLTDDRQVASTPHICPSFTKSVNNTIIHPIIPAK